MTSDNFTINLATVKDQLTRQIEPCLSATAAGWLQQAINAIKDSEQMSEDLGLYSAMAKRKLGSAPLENADPINTEFSPLDIHRWTIADCGRLVLLISAIQQSPEPAEKIVTAYYTMGDESERMALMRGLMLFTPANYLTDLALDAGRTNSPQMLASVMQENPYPARYYSEQAFNQMVLKGLFMGLAIERVVGLAQRANPELTRMCESFVVEREDAGREVPVDIWLAIEPFASEMGQQKMVEYLNHEDIGHRYYCLLALRKRLAQDPPLLNLIKTRVEQEQEPLIQKLLQEILHTSTNASTETQE